MELYSDIVSSQKAVCQKYVAEWRESRPDQMIGIAKDIKNGEMPINGLRHPEEKNTTGWYIWSGGELDTNPEKFEAVHVGHLTDTHPKLLKYLGLPPGWRFQVDHEGYEDVWYDPSLLNT